MTPIRIVVVDDYEPFRRVIHTLLRDSSFNIVGEASDGLDALKKSSDLRPDLILLDIGLPGLNGIEVARRVTYLAPQSKILFVSQETSDEVIQAALASPIALGYVFKSRIQTDLLPAIESVLAGRRYASQQQDPLPAAGQANAQAPVRHEVLFYSQDATLIDAVAGFVARALRKDNPAIVIATESHREGFVRKLEENGVDVKGVVQKGLYISLDVSKLLPEIMVDGALDGVRFHNTLEALIVSASEAARTKRFRIALFGECISLLCAEGNPHAALRLEKSGNVFLHSHHAVDILCGCPLNLFPGGEPKDVYEGICREHSSVRVQ